MIQKDLLVYSVACSPVLDIWLGNVDLTPADCQEFNVSIMEFQHDYFLHKCLPTPRKALTEYCLGSQLWKSHQVLY